MVTIMSNEITIGFIQMEVEDGNRKKNFEMAKRKITELTTDKDLDLIVLPELFDTGFAYEKYMDLDAELPGETTEFLSKLAQDNYSYIVTTTIEKADFGKYYNTAVLINRDGKIIGVYRKVHPFQDEKQYFEPGTELTVFRTEIGSIGIEICYDLRFPEVARSLALANIDILITPASFPFPRQSHWDILTVARAIENQIFHVAVNRVGSGIDKEYFGHSKIIDPWGNIIVGASESPRISAIDVDLDMIKEVRDQITCFEDRKNIAYSKIFVADE